MKFLSFVLAALWATSATAQQAPDPSADLSVAHPAYTLEAGPRVMIDGAHHNFHTVDGRYGPFAQLLRNDGFRVAGNDVPFSDAALAQVDVLVIANALAAEDVEEWRTPNPSAFTTDEIAAILRFVARGGSLLLIADHMPFAGAAQDLGAALGVSFDNGFAQDADMAPDLFTRENGGLVDDPIAAGVSQVRTFTGSAFTASGPNVRPVLRLGPQWTVMLPEVAWEFSDATPRVSGDGRLQGAVITLDQGRVAVFGEAAMFTAQVAGPQATPMGLRAPGAEQNKQFALNVMRWLAGVR